MPMLVVVVAAAAAATTTTIIMSKVARRGKKILKILIQNIPSMVFKGYVVDIYL
jgi:hypothetical protein